MHAKSTWIIAIAALMGVFAANEATAAEPLELQLSARYASAWWANGVTFQGPEMSVGLGNSGIGGVPGFAELDLFHGLSTHGLHLTHVRATAGAQFLFGRLRLGLGGRVGWLIIPRRRELDGDYLHSLSIGAMTSATFDIIETDGFDLYLGGIGSASYPWMFEAAATLGVRWSL